MKTQRKWFDRLTFGSRRSRRRNPARTSRRMAFEPLEARQLLSVTTAADNDVAFQTTDQNMWDSGPALQIDESFSYDLLDVSFDPITLGGFVDIPFFGQTGLRGSFGGGLKLGVSGEFSMDGGSVDVDYQTDMTVEALTLAYAPATSLQFGDHFILRASESPDTDVIAMETRFANIAAGLYLDYGVDINASLLGKILGKTVVNAGINESFGGSVELIGAELDLGSGVGEVRLLAGIPLIGQTWALEDELHKELSGGILAFDGYIPSLNTGVDDDDYDDSDWDDTTGTMVNTQFEGFDAEGNGTIDRNGDNADNGRTRIDFFKLTLGLDDIVTKIAKIPLNVSVGNDVVGLDVTLVNADVEAYLGLAQTMTFDPTMMVDYNFLDGPGENANPASVVVETSPGSRIFENVTTKRMTLGEDLEVIHTGETIYIDTDYVLGGTFHNDTAIYLSPNFNLAIAEFELSGSLVDTAVDLISGLDSDDLSFSLYNNNFSLGPYKLISMTDNTFDLGGFSEVDGSNLDLTASLPTDYRVVALADDSTIAEGEDMVVTGTIYDPNGATDGSDTYTLAINWRDGPTQTVTLDGNTTASDNGVRFDRATRVFSATHRYADDFAGTRAVSFTATRTTADPDGTVPTYGTTISVQVADVAVDVDVDPLVIDNIGNATLTGSYIDPGVNDTHELWVGWGESVNTSGEWVDDTSVFMVPAIVNADPDLSSLSVGQTISSLTEEWLVDSTLKITSIDASTGRVEFEVTGYSYAGKPGYGQSAVKMVDDHKPLQKDWCDLEVPWRPDLTVSQTTPTVTESGPVELEVAFDMESHGSPVKCSVDWDDPNDSQPSTFDFTLGEPIGTRFYAQEENATLILTDVQDITGTNFVRVTMTLERAHQGTLTPYVDDGPASGDGTPAAVSNVKVQVTTDVHPPTSTRVVQDQGSRTVPITVYNAVPTLTLDWSTELVGPTGLALIGGTISDPGIYDTHEMSIIWGDGSSFDNDDDPNTTDDLFELLTFDPSATGSRAFMIPHVYTQDLDGGTYTVTVTVSDDDTSTAARSHDVTIDHDLSPVAFDDYFVTGADEVLLIDPLADNDRDGRYDDPNPNVEITSTDSDPESRLDRSRITFVDGSLVVPGDSGSGDWDAIVVLNSNGTITFDPTASVDCTHYFDAQPAGDTIDVEFQYQIEDSAGQTDIGTVLVTIQKKVGGPILTSNQVSASYDEGETAVNSGFFTDGDNTGVVTIAASVGTIQQTASTWSWSYTPADGPEGLQIVTFTATDYSGAHRSVYFPLTVNNVAPTFALAGAPNAVQGSPYELTLGAVTDPGDDTVTSYLVDWGDDSTFDNDSDPSTAEDSFEVFYPTLNEINVTGMPAYHTYTERTQKHFITADLVDEDGTYADAGALTVDNVVNAPPTIDSVTSSGPVEEGSPVTITVWASDPGNDPLMYEFDFDGDGKYEAYGPSPSVSHIFADDGSYTVGVRVQDNDGVVQYGHATGFISVTVQNSPPMVIITGPDTVYEGETVSYSFTAIDPGADTVSIMHADSSFGDVSNLVFDDKTGSGSFDVTVTQDGLAYLQAESVSVLAQDSDLAVGMGHIEVFVDNVAPTIAEVTNTGLLLCDGQLTTTVTVSASDPAGENDPLVYEFDFNGDGNWVASVSPSASSDTFTEYRPYTVGVRVTDDDGGVTEGFTIVRPLELLVDTLVDEQDGVTVGGISLRDAIAAVADGGLITFDQSLSDGTITLNGMELAITRGLTIEGADNNITIDADGLSRVFNVDDGDGGNKITVSLAGLTITGGSSSAYPNSLGGGGLSNVENLQIINSVIRGNSDTYRGGGIDNAGTLSITDSTISGNSAGNEGGGGISNLWGGTLVITDSTISDNWASTKGGGISNWQWATASITNSTISGNSAAGGGGIHNSYNSRLSITNSTISGNSATTFLGGGIHNHIDSQLSLVNSTVSGNSANKGAGGLVNYLSTADIVSSIIADNTATTGLLDLQNAMGTINASYSLIENNADQINGDVNSNNITGQDPRLDPAGLQDNGGPTRTIALQAGSPAIDAGSNPDNLAFDQRGDGFTRAFNGQADIGAYEFELADAVAAVQDQEQPEVALTLASDDQLDAVITAVAALSEPQQPRVIIVNLSGDEQYSLGEVNVPPQVTLVINGLQGDPVVFVGSSPALILESGAMVVNHATFINGTEAPSILVTGGSLTIRNSTIEESTGEEAQAAITILGGTVDLGTVGDPGGNTLVVNGPGEFVDNRTEIPMLTMGNTFEVDAMPAFSPSDLVLFGTPGADRVKFQSTDAPGEVEVSATNMTTVTLTPSSGRLIAYGGAGDDTMQASGDVAQAVWLFGEEGNDRLKGGGSDDLLSGGSGDDLLVGKNGLDLLIGGLGADRLVGNKDDDILVAGRVTLHEAYLDMLMGEWTSGSDYATRQAAVSTYLRTDGGDPTVIADDSKDVLTGSSGFDWFFANLGETGVKDKITDLGAGEFLLDLEFILAD